MIDRIYGADHASRYAPFVYVARGMFLSGYKQNRPEVLHSLALLPPPNLLRFRLKDHDSSSIAGNGGTILQTTSGGFCWSLQTSGTTSSLTGLRSGPDGEKDTVVSLRIVSPLGEKLLSRSGVALHTGKNSLKTIVASGSFQIVVESPTGMKALMLIIEH